MSRMRRFVRFVVVPLVMGAAMLAGSNPALAGDSAWTRALVHADSVADSAADGSAITTPADSAWT
ncbi:hypothetical protein GCM10010193_10480 [Kitasatospora atroaurantiaca]|uniref:Uncharacterized protein n=1 Tax=Kitasatospora atroaurantiaca TaxID=285545 RepID=A0A561ESC2_9ACTN|nr:hypothetical protein [Kitasatospora atroaurantiaca]TWE18496.1 hypothetical protein FB465_3574 [Kitasatospora atroaurantiaca]